jgi:hypothetical protein
LSIYENEFFGEKFTEQERLYFYETLKHSIHFKKPFKVSRFSEPWRFVLQVQPNIITKVAVKNVDHRWKWVPVNKNTETRFTTDRLQTSRMNIIPNHQ